MKKLFLITACALGLSAVSAYAQSSYTLNVSEGTSGGLDSAQVIEKYTGLAEVMSKALGKKVVVVVTREFAQLEEGMKSGKMDFVIARPSDYPARGVRDYKYQLISTSKPDGNCLLIVPKASPLKNINDVKGKRITLPEKISYMSKFCSAELIHNGFKLETEKIQYAKEQGAVIFYLDNQLADVGGIASYSGVAKNLEKTGHRVIHTSQSQPYQPLIAHPKFTAAQIQALKKELDHLDETEPGKAILKPIGIKEFDTKASDQSLLDLLKWLGQ
ncbi:phosphate/phosphite/phosphonate ABC transporter substrate-binding protein [Undibacterium sp. CY18W]|uniref:Phosphate/phosphite/phosphonate ABC transporter substrate-binding protein n=1 Tax=Undibacterium hunanense TaxID=2762292 RepID=A0ABR6ZPP9_9BURK|nr:PhnD/SsuA/transferrin family substrate-binding protein [Undibacterium hunanense]MBC3917875.1 phosphate/phosphite/phosphonate ABC transporter substrate-binding protein [Undibacterium hunanense]